MNKNEKIVHANLCTQTGMLEVCDVTDSMTGGGRERGRGEGKEKKGNADQREHMMTGKVCPSREPG